MKLDELSQSQRALLLGTIVLVSVVILMLLAEAAVRLRSALKYGFSSSVEDILVVDPKSGLRVPVARAVAGGIRINSLGFRGPEILRVKPPGTVRIAFLGGSTTYCAEVSGNEATWPELVARNLADRFPDVRLDYVNAGVPGYGLEALSKSLEMRVAPLDPDVIVIYEATNDLSGNSFNLAKKQGLIDKRPDQGRLWLSPYSLLVRLVEFNLAIRARQAREAQPEGKLQVDLDQLAAPFEANLDRLLEDAASVSPLVAVATFSVQFRRGQDRARQLQAAETSLFYMPYMTLDGLLDSFDAYNRVIVEVAARHHAVLVDGHDSIPGDREHFNDSVHFTDAGSRAMADRVTRALAASPRFQALVQNAQAGLGR